MGDEDGPAPQLRHVRLNRAALRLRQLDLRLLRDDESGGLVDAAELPRDRTEMAPRADDHRRFDVVVRDPAIARATQRRERRSFEDARAGSPEQKLIELAPADRVADDGVVARLDFAPVDHARPEAVEGLDDETGGAILVGIQAKRAHDGRRDPAELLL